METFISRHYRYLLTGLICILMVLSFLIGREDGRNKGGEDAVILSCSPEVLSALEIGPLQASAGKDGPVPAAPAVLSADVPGKISGSTAVPAEGQFVGSRNGTKYYTPGCSGTVRIKPENYVWFSDEEDATMQGYSKGSC